MIVSLDISPLSKNSGHSIRGSGFYCKHLKEELLKSNKLKLQFFEAQSNTPEVSDIYHVPYFDPFFLTINSKHISKTIVTVHDLIPLKFPKHFSKGLKGYIKWRIQKNKLQKVPAVITDSHASKRDISNLAGINKNKIHVIYLAADSRFKKISDNKLLEKTRKKYNLPEKFVLYVGDATWNKNLPRLLKASLKAQVPLILAGKTLSEKVTDSTHPWAKDLVTSQSLIQKNQALSTLGFVPDDDLVALYNLATVFAMPSLYEGFGLPVLEAMACGTPVITSKEGSLSEVSKKAAFCVDPYDEKSISQGIKQVVEDREIRKKLSTLSIENSKKFSWKKTADQTIKVYEKVHRTNR